MQEIPTIVTLVPSIAPITLKIVTGLPAIGMRDAPQVGIIHNVVLEIF
jgi:hypothetical protein